MNGTVANVHDYLTELGLVDGSSDWPCIRRRIFDGPGNRVVVLTEDGGGSPQIPGPEGTLGDVALMDPAVQVYVRGDPWDSDTAVAKALEIMEALHGKVGFVMGDRYYLRAVAQSSEPVFIGFDDKTGRPQFTQSFRFATGVVAEEL